MTNWNLEYCVRQDMLLIRLTQSINATNVNSCQHRCQEERSDETDAHESTTTSHVKSPCQRFVAQTNMSNQYKGLLQQLLCYHVLQNLSCSYRKSMGCQLSLWRQRCSLLVPGTWSVSHNHSILLSNMCCSSNTIKNNWRHFRLPFPDNYAK